MAKIKASPTPNPNSLKFTLQKGHFMEAGMESFNTAQEAAGHPLAERLFSIAGVSNVFILPDFLTVTKEPGAQWDTIVSGVEAVIDEVVERR